MRSKKSGGGGIRTHVAVVNHETVFKTVAFDRSATPPLRSRSVRYGPGGEVAERLKATAC
jgi:hypothetical protein